MQELAIVEHAIKSKDAEAFSEALRYIQDRKILVSIFSSVLLDDWHEAHEDIVFELGLIRDPRATNAIVTAATIPFQYLIDWGNLHEFQRKCAYALARIGTEESKKALEVLSQNLDPYISNYGHEGLEYWPLNQ